MVVPKTVLGLDIGSVSISAVVMDLQQRILQNVSLSHEGDIEAALRALSADLDLSTITGTAFTGEETAGIKCSRFYDSQIACIEWVRKTFPKAQAVLSVGSEKFSLICFDENGRYKSIRTNTSCAAGTGSFLDQQARRLNMEGSNELGRVALENGDPIPLVATRCAVFAKTDLIHAQQEGFTLPGISEGLCQGLASNLVDTLFKDPGLKGPVVFTGGVSRNDAVFKELSAILDVEIIRDRLGGFQGAAGAALLLLAEIEAGNYRLKETYSLISLVELFSPEKMDRSGFYSPLVLKLSEYPDFSSYKNWDQVLKGRPGQPFVEVDLYNRWPGSFEAYLGFDIGSTSTKAVVTDPEGRIFGGFYTSTSGRPLDAVQALLETIILTTKKEGTELKVIGCGTTGSGRKFIGKLIQADLVLDEISAHARAAYEQDPLVDTILEIGGQDAKFTILKNGRVTFSVMNNVCAAGTGSFLEEQAAKLGVPIRDFAALTDGVRAPGVSDRCTVFMERDINHLIARGCTVPEVLAAALHAVRENYLRKVAVEKNIGKRIFFQGATGRNRSLVAAFEQKLKKPILVSPYCHLTGALGVALSLGDDKIRSDSFPGLDFAWKNIPLRREVCQLCRNHCKLTVADLDGKNVAFGFLCGRDYDTGTYVNRNRSGWDLLKERRKLENRLLEEAVTVCEHRSGQPPVLGIPDGLYLVEDRLYWEVFLRELGFPVISGGAAGSPIKEGKPLTGAEFCAPIAAFHGHAAALLEKCDYLFLPVYLERKRGKNGEVRKFCYYSQYASSMIWQAIGSDRILNPLAATRYSNLQLISEIYHCFSNHPGLKRSVLQISAAIEKAEEVRTLREKGLKELLLQNRRDENTVDVLFMGRPYTVLPGDMNKGIPDIFSSLGVRGFYQDMLDYDQDSLRLISPLLREINWSYGARILEASEVVARTPGLYPVIITSFKCGPDSYINDYVRRILDQHDKPYLVLELDELDSAVGYETRIEAAVRSFRNHLGVKSRQKVLYNGINPTYDRVLHKEHSLVFPNWDDYAIPLIAAILNSQGYRTYVMEETEETIRRSLKWNNGQCLPMNAIVEGFAATVKKYALDPAETRLWIPGADFSCNIKLFPHHIQNLLFEYGQGMEKARVYRGQMTFMDFSPLITADVYLVYMFSGLIRRIACRIRPYEKNPGQTDKAVAESRVILQEVFSDRTLNKTHAVEQVLQLFEWIPCEIEEQRPKVALFGDLYVRDNPVMNQDIIHFIEKNGGEVVTMPYHEYTRMTVDTYFRRWTKDLKFGRLLKLKPILAALETMEKWYYRHFERILEEPMNRYNENEEEILRRFGVRMDHEGESLDNLLKTWYISRQYPDLSLFVQLIPGFCCAGLVTEAMARKVREVTGVPVLSITYDGTGGVKNNAVTPYLKYPPLRTKEKDFRQSV